MTKPNDAYQWRILYQDGSVLDEFDQARPDGRGFDEREAKPVAAILLMTWHPFADQQYIVQIPADAEPIFFRRRAVIVNQGSDEAMQPGTLAHCIGWRRSAEDACYLFVFDDGSVLMTDYLQAI